MVYLFAVSIIWAFSFGLIKGHLTGIDPNYVAFMRMLISFLVFAPLLEFRKLSIRLGLHFLIIGLIQFGIMYITYISSYRYLKAYEVALFTILTPIYVSLIYDLFRRRFSRLNFLTAFFAVAGTGIVIYHGLLHSDIITGFCLVQISNVCFALGQVYYKKILLNHKHIKDQNIFGLLYLGALLITGITAGITTGWSPPAISGQQFLTLLYLGILASGVGFFLWNYGARRVNVGALAVFNNLKIPLAVAVSILFFKEQGNIFGLLLGGTIVVGALLINEYGVILHDRLRTPKP